MGSVKCSSARGVSARRNSQMFAGPAQINFSERVSGSDAGGVCCKRMCHIYGCDYNCGIFSHSINVVLIDLFMFPLSILVCSWRPSVSARCCR